MDAADADVVSLEPEAAALSDSDKLAEVDLDDQTPAMGDRSTPTSSPSADSLLTAEQGDLPSGSRRAVRRAQAGDLGLESSVDASA